MGALEGTSQSIFSELTYQNIQRKHIGNYLDESWEGRKGGMTVRVKVQTLVGQ